MCLSQWSDMGCSDPPLSRGTSPFGWLLFGDSVSWWDMIFWIWLLLDCDLLVWELKFVACSKGNHIGWNLEVEHEGHNVDFHWVLPLLSTLVDGLLLDYGSDSVVLLWILFSSFSRLIISEKFEMLQYWKTCVCPFILSRMIIDERTFTYL